MRFVGSLIVLGIVGTFGFIKLMDWLEGRKENRRED